MDIAELRKLDSQGLLKLKAAEPNVAIDLNESPLQKLQREAEEFRAGLVEKFPALGLNQPTPLHAKIAELKKRFEVPPTHPAPFTPPISQWPGCSPRVRTVLLLIELGY